MLLFFHMADGWQALDVALLSIALDPADQQAYNITVPMLVDANKSVSQAYDVLQWATATGEPGHTFVLVNTDGAIAWVRDYGSPQLPNPTMYVPVTDLVQQVRDHLAG